MTTRACRLLLLAVGTTRRLDVFHQSARIARDVDAEGRILVIPFGKTESSRRRVRIKPTSHFPLDVMFRTPMSRAAMGFMASEPTTRVSGAARRCRFGAHLPGRT